MKSEAAHVSDFKRQLIEQYLGGDPRRSTAGEPLTSVRRRGDPPVTGRGREFVLLRELSLQDYPQVAALESQYGLGLQGYDQWSHVWLHNPAYQELQKNWPIGWVLVNDKKQIVGAHGNIPLLYEFRKKRIIAASGRGMVVDSRYRSYALWLLASFFDQKNAEICFDTTPSYEAARDNEVLGALRVPVGAWDRNVFWITNYRGCLSIWLKTKIPKQMWPMIGPLCLPLSATLFLKDTLARPAVRKLRNGLVVEYCTAFDEGFDEFWEGLRTDYPDLLLAVRTREVLQWHFAYAILQNRLWIWRVKQDSRIAAYAVFLKTENPKSGITRVSLVDFQALKANTGLVMPMLAAALERCRKERVHLLENVGLSFGKSGINKFAPYQRRDWWWTYFYKARDKDLSDMLNSPRAWAPSLYDGDASIL